MGTKWEQSQGENEKVNWTKTHAPPFYPYATTRGQNRNKGRKVEIQ